jgi:hypothetical protein
MILGVEVEFNQDIIDEIGRVVLCLLAHREDLLLLIDEELVDHDLCNSLDVVLEVNDQGDLFS